MSGIIGSVSDVVVILSSTQRSSVTGNTYSTLLQRAFEIEPETLRLWVHLCNYRYFFAFFLRLGFFLSFLLLFTLCRLILIYLGDTISLTIDLLLSHRHNILSLPHTPCMMKSASARLQRHLSSAHLYSYASWVFLLTCFNVSAGWLKSCWDWKCNSTRGPWYETGMRYGTSAISYIIFCLFFRENLVFFHISFISTQNNFLISVEHYIETYFIIISMYNKGVFLTIA